MIYQITKANFQGQIDPIIAMLSSFYNKRLTMDACALVSSMLDICYEDSYVTVTIETDSLNLFLNTV